MENHEAIRGRRSLDLPFGHAVLYHSDLLSELVVTIGLICPDFCYLPRIRWRNCGKPRRNKGVDGHWISRSVTRFCIIATFCQSW